MKLNMLTVVGIVVVGFGSYLIYLGSEKNSKISQKEITDKINETQEKINQLKNSQVDTIKIAKIETEFHEWADSFIENKDKSKIELERSELKNKHARLQMNDLVRPQYLIFFETIKKLIDAYNAKTNNSIKYNIKILPLNIYDPISIYDAEIFFSNDIKWKIELRPPSALQSELQTDISLFVVDKDDKEQDALTIHQFDKKVALVIHRNLRMNLTAVPKVFELSNETYKTIAKKLIETQLLQL